MKRRSRKTVEAPKKSEADLLQEQFNRDQELLPELERALVLLEKGWGKLFEGCSQEDPTEKKIRVYLEAVNLKDRIQMAREMVERKRRQVEEGKKKIRKQQVAYLIATEVL